MRITMKGGVWKNSEDEILKAAVMKYGLNNWSRVASLLVRKSAKQCKARWYEWLDPTVKKTEWTRDEEEKLLHLAKLFPTQWRTIAPIVGRTAHQCFEHYERLLDQAQGKDPDDQNDPRRYRPGEIDPHPETKPSRADPVDMDEDEKEMLAEARARLANTRGKKAKRKAREKQLEEARRLASLQKRRELKAAGIQLGKRHRKNKNEMDLGVEIPFEQKPARGFHALGPEETPEGNLSFANISLQQLEGKRRDAEEEKLRKDDMRKLKRLKADDLQAAQELIDKLNDPQSIRKRTRLALPEPQLSDLELEEIVRASHESSRYLAEAAEGDGAMGGISATAGLLPQAVGPLASLGQYTPVRTPGRDNTILMEAENAATRRTMQTPLEGGETPEMHKTRLGELQPTPQRTPNPLAAAATRAALKGGGGGGDTPLSLFGASRASAASSAAATPLDSSSMMNSGMSEFAGSGAAGSKARQALLTMQVRTSLANLPAPSNEIEVALPDESELSSEAELRRGANEEAIEVDMEDVEMKKAAEIQKKKDEEQKGFSKVLQQGLPRPVFPDTCHFPVSYSAVSSELELEADDERKRRAMAQTAMHQAEVLMHDEMRSLIAKEAARRPVSKAIKPKNISILTEDDENFDLDELKNAELLVQLECQILEQEVNEKNQSTNGSSTSTPSDDDWAVANRSFIYVPQASRYVASHQANAMDRMESLKRQFEDLKCHLNADNARADKLQNKLDVLTKGYRQRAETLLKTIEENWTDANNLDLELMAFEILSKQEAVAMDKRREEMRLLVEEEKEKHSGFQREYAALQQGTAAA